MSIEDVLAGLPLDEGQKGAILAEIRSEKLLYEALLELREVVAQLQVMTERKRITSR